MLPARFSFLDRTPAAPWLKSALREIRNGIAEVPGRGSNAVIIHYRKIAKIDIKGDDSDVPWCAIGVNAMLEENGIVGTRSALARSFTKDPGFEKLSAPMLGAITVISSSRGSWSGHVGIYVGEVDGYVYLAGGNQDDAWAIDGFPARRVVGHYWPRGQAKPPAPYNAPFSIKAPAKPVKATRDA